MNVHLRKLHGVTGISLMWGPLWATMFTVLVGVIMWARATVCYCKIDGTWMVTYEHESVPFDPQSGKASLNLKP